MQGFGCFKQALWLGIAESEAIQKLTRSLDSALSIVGIEQERKPFVPHLTVARLRANARVKISELQADYGHRDWGTLEVGTVHLFESETLPEGARYTKLACAGLAS